MFTKFAYLRVIKHYIGIFKRPIRGTSLRGPEVALALGFVESVYWKGKRKVFMCKGTKSI